MRITRVNVKKFDNPEAAVKGVAEVTLNNCFVVKDIRIIEKPEKMVVAMPSKSYVAKNVEEGEEGVRKHKDLAHPINAETRKIFNDIILAVFERATDSEYEEVVDVLVSEG